MWTSPSAGGSKPRYPTGGTTVLPSEYQRKPRSMSPRSVSSRMTRWISASDRISGRSATEHLLEGGQGDVPAAQHDGDGPAGVARRGLAVRGHGDGGGALDRHVVLGEHEAD